MLIILFVQWEYSRREIKNYISTSNISSVGGFYSIMKIALLLPKSVIYPSISFDIMDGFKQSLKKIGLEGHHEIVSTNIGVGARNNEVYERCEQFLLDGADVIIAYINPQIAEFIHSLFVESGKTLLVLDSGYHFPNFRDKLSNAYFISLQGGLCAKVIVDKAIKDGFKKFAFTCSFYDAGYRPSFVIPSTVKEKGGEIVLNHVTQLRREDFTLDPLVNYIKENQEVAILSTFCGDMAEDFFRGLKDFNGNYSLYGGGFLSDEVWLSKIPYTGRDWSSTVAWSRELETKENQEFLAVMNVSKPDKANLFSLLAWEAALFIAFDKTDFDDISIISPRGKVWMNPETRFTEAPIYYATVCKDEVSGNCKLKNLQESSETENERRNLELNIEYIRNNEANTWFNAYACLES